MFSLSIIRRDHLPRDEAVPTAERRRTDASILKVIDLLEMRFICMMKEELVA